MPPACAAQHVYYCGNRNAQYSSSADGTAKDDLRSTQCGLTYQVCKPRLVKSPMTKMRVM